MKFKRVNVDGPGDDPDEYLFECNDCEGTGQVHVDDNEDERLSHLVTCPNCGGSGIIEGDASDVDA
jgi:DnaJ-class molecular chaperone